MLVGERIKEERERLGLSQEAFALHGGVSKRSQIMYEQGKTEASAVYFTLIDKIGADISYVLTGTRTKNCTLKEASAGYSGKSINKTVEKMGELMEQLTAEQQREIFFVIEEKKRMNTLEEKLDMLMKKAG